MLKKIIHQSIKQSKLCLHSQPLIRKQLLNMNNKMTIVPMRGYFNDNVIMDRNYGDGYMIDPIETAERVVRCIALHDNVIDPSDITLRKSFEEIGLNALDMCEIYIMLEKEFDFEISEDDCETFHTVNDLVEFIARNFYAK